MIGPQSQPGVKRQCALLQMNRSTYYYHPREANTEDLELMRRIDEQYLKTPFFGSRKMAKHLSTPDKPINRKRVQRLMGLMGLVSISPGPNTSKRHPQHKVSPYLPSNLDVARPNQVWAADITYIPMAKGFLYLFAIVDWCSRKVLAWRLGNTLDTSFCLEALDEALACYGTPDIFNTDQGVQFTSEAFTQRLKESQIRISMDGKGCYRDNIFVERLWRTAKYGCIYIHALEDGKVVKNALKGYFLWHNQQRLHQALDYQTPEQRYTQAEPIPLAA